VEAACAAFAPREYLVLCLSERTQSGIHDMLDVVDVMTVYLQHVLIPLRLGLGMKIAWSSACGIKCNYDGDISNRFISPLCKKHHLVEIYNPLIFLAFFDLQRDSLVNATCKN
jgi:hypothetical protein